MSARQATPREWPSTCMYPNPKDVEDRDQHQHSSGSHCNSKEDTMEHHDETKETSHPTEKTSKHENITKDDV